MGGEATRGVLRQEESRAVKQLLQAFKDSGVVLAPEVAEYAVACFIEAVCDERLDDEPAWMQAMLETLETCEASDNEDDRQTIAESFARACFTASRKQAPSWRRVPKAGDRCYAVLAEDGEWHEAVVERLIDARDSAPAPTVAVRFTEYGKVQEVELGSIQATGHDASSDDEVDMVGACELCRRVDIALTRHHLIPRRTHAKYKKRGVSSKELEVSAYICRPCHSAVHKAEDEFTLADKYHTVELLLRHPKIQKSAAYFGKQAVRNVR
mmetsp:Transcript_34669/g.87408  ORF Transcript_34669/g.87408 Transcript_34669/m.87408 type:complete len:268 (+) Transcript_34669:266-1069(+)